MQKALKALIEQTQNGTLSWEVREYDPILFMSEIGVEEADAETENFALNLAFVCHSEMGRVAWFEVYESIGFDAAASHPLRSLAYYQLRFHSPEGDVLYQKGKVIKDRQEHLLFCQLADEVFKHTQPFFVKHPRNDPAAFVRYLHACDESGGLETHPLSQLMTEWYRDNRCLEFHLLAMACLN